MPLSSHSADLLATAEANGTAYQGPATIYLALMTSLSDALTPGTEIAGDGYARVAYAASDYANNGTGQLSNTSAISWAEALEDWGIAVEIAAFDAATDGNPLWYEPMDEAVTIANTETFVIDPGVLVRQAV